MKTMNTTNRNVSYFGTVGRTVYSAIQLLETGGFNMTVSQAVGIFSYQMKTFTVISGSTSSGFQDGPFSEVRFNDPVDLSFWNSHTLLVSDYTNDKLRILDLITNTSSSICTSADGDFSSCSIDGPWELLILEEKIYIGAYQRIKIIECTY